MGKVQPVDRLNPACNVLQETYDPQKIINRRFYPVSRIIEKLVLHLKRLYPSPFSHECPISTARVREMDHSLCTNITGLEKNNVINYFLAPGGILLAPGKLLIPASQFRGLAITASLYICSFCDQWIQSLCIVKLGLSFFVF